MGKQRLSQRVLSLLLACVMLLTCAPTAFAESTEAALMRLMKTEGTVSVTNSKGRSVTVRDDMRLNSGYGLETEEASYAWINLDDAKLVKMDAVSEISIRKSGKKLDILLDSGNLFFNVSKPLEEEETFNIRTSTMAVGIRGTCGWVKVIDQWTSVLYVLEGTVTVTVTDPVTGQAKTETVKGGETVICKVYPQDTSGSRCDIIRQTFTVSDIDGFVLVELVKDNDLCNKIYEDSGLDIRNSGINAAEKLKEDQQEVHEKLKQIEEQGREQENNVSQDPVWTDPEKDGTETSDNSDDCDSTTTAPAGPTETVNLTMPKTAAEVNETLSRANVRQVVLQPGARARASTASLLEVDSALTVPSGKVLTLQSGVGLTAENGQLLAVQGTLTVGGDFRLAGDLAAGSQGVIRAIAFKLAASVESWKVSSTTDSTGYYTLTYSPKGVYTVTFNANGGSVSPAQMKTGTDSRLASLPTPTRSGYNFDGWFTAAEGGEQVTTIYVFKQDATVYAHWTSASGTGWRYDEGTRTLYILGSGPMEEYNVTTTSDGLVTNAPWGKYASQMRTLIIADGITETGHCSFWGCSGLTSVTIPNSVTRIAYGTFQGCDRLTSIAIPDKVTSIGAYAFDGCSGLKNIDIPEGVTEIGVLTFRGCTGLTNVTIPDSVTTISVDAFLNCSGLKSVTVPTGITRIGAEAFYGCTSLTDVYFRGTESQWNNLRSNIEEKNESLLNATIHCTDGDITPGGETSGVTWSYDSATKTLYIKGSGPMEDYASDNSSSANLIRPWKEYVSEIENLVIDNGITTIGDMAFASVKGLTSVTIPDSVISIGSSAFAASGLSGTITIPNSVTTIKAAAFYNCNSMNGVLTIPDSVTTIGSNAFDNTGLSGTLTIPGSVTSIGLYALNAEFTDVYYAGTEAQWNNITLGNSVIPSTATMHYNSTARSAVSYTTPSIYTDVPAGASYAEAVQYCKDNNLMDGTSADKFSPDGTLTRAMMVTVLHRLAGKPHAYATASFADVAPNKWYSDAISWASGKGIVNGYNPTTFGANDPVTHEQVGLILQRYSGDQSIQVTGGESPKTPATRAEVAVTLMNYAKGRKPGPLSDASAIDVMCAPSGIALDKDGSLLVTDVYGKQLWKVQNRNGTAYAGGATVIDLYGQPMGGYNDASLQGSYFKEPWAIAPFLDGWAVSDTANNVVRLVSGGSVRTLNGATNEKLKVTNLGVAFNGPTGLAADDDGNLYVSDTGSGAVRRINPKGGVMTVAKNLSEPTGLCWKDGVLYIAETGKNRILKLTNGKTSTLAGNGIEGLTDGIGSESSFSAPQGVAVGDDGTVYVADTGNGAVRQIKGGAVTTLAVRDPEQLSGGLMSPVGLLARGNSLYICDTFARKIFVYQLG